MSEMFKMVRQVQTRIECLKHQNKNKQKKSCRCPHTVFTGARESMRAFRPTSELECHHLVVPKGWTFWTGLPFDGVGKPNTTSQQAAVGASRPRRATSRCFQMSLRVHTRPPPSASQRKKLGGHTQMWWCLLAKEMCELGTPHPMSQTLVGGGCGGILHQKAKKQSWWGWQIKKKRRKRREGLHPIRALASSVRNVSHQSKLFLILR